MIDHYCMTCNTQLTSDEIALHRKLRSKAAKTYACFDCQAKYCNTTREKLEQLVATYHRTGLCSLFAKSEERGREE